MTNLIELKERQENILDALDKFMKVFKHNSRKDFSDFSDLTNLVKDLHDLLEKHPDDLEYSTTEHFTQLRCKFSQLRADLESKEIQEEIDRHPNIVINQLNKLLILVDKACASGERGMTSSI